MNQDFYVAVNDDSLEKNILDMLMQHSHEQFPSGSFHELCPSGLSNGHYVTFSHVDLA